MQWNTHIEDGDTLNELYNYRVDDVAAHLSLTKPANSYVVEGKIEKYIPADRDRYKIIYYSRRTTEHEALAREHLSFERQRLEHIVNREAELMALPEKSQGKLF